MTRTDVQVLIERADAMTGYDVGTMAAVLEALTAAAEVSVELAAPLVARLWFTPWRIDAGDAVAQREAAWLSAARPVEIQVGKGSLTGYTAGHGPTVLLVHGWGDRASRLGALVEPLVAAGFRALAVDLPGHGGNAPALTDLYVMTDALATVIRDEHVHAVVAHSMGAVASARAMQDAPRVEAACFIAPAVRLESAVARFAELFALPPAAIDALRGYIEDRFGAGVWDDFHTDDLVTDWRRPGLLIADADDDQVPLSDIRLVAAAWPGARLLETQGLGHTKLLRDLAVVDEVVSFLSVADRAGVGLRRTAGAVG